MSKAIIRDRMIKNSEVIVSKKTKPNKSQYETSRNGNSVRGKAKIHFKTHKNSTTRLFQKL